MSNTPLETIRRLLSGLHFAQDAMGIRERETLHLAETLLRRIDALLEKIDADERELEPMNRFAPEDDQIPVVLTGDEVREILTTGRFEAAP